jgi:hypothetical protein
MVEAERKFRCDVYEEFEAIHNELECAIDSYATSIEMIQILLMDLEDEERVLRSRLIECDKALYKYRLWNPRVFE